MAVTPVFYLALNTVITLLQVKDAAYSAAGSGAVTFNNPCTPGSLIIVTMTLEDPPNTITGVSDPTNGTYATDVSVTNTNGSGNGIAAIYSKANTASTALTITGAISTTGQYGHMVAYEITGHNVTTPLNVTGSGSGLATAHTISFTTTANNCFIAAITHHYPPTITLDSGYTQAFAETGFNGYDWGEYRVNSGGLGLVTLTAGLGTENSWAFAAAAYKPA